MASTVIEIGGITYLMCETPLDAIVRNLSLFEEVTIEELDGTFMVIDIGLANGKTLISLLRFK